MLTMFDSIAEIKKTILTLKHSLEVANAQNDTEIFTIISALVAIFEIAEASEHKKHILTPEEITDIGEQTFSLIDNLVYKLGSQKSEFQQQICLITLTITRWIVNHHGVLNNIQPIVDTLAFFANTIQDKSLLKELAHFMTQIAHACNDNIVHDLDNANPSRPWRVLNLNRGIVATRSFDLGVMNTVFPELIEAIPMDAPEFFEEGMSEMIRLNYPDEIAALMQAYRDRTKLPAIH